MSKKDLKVGVDALLGEPRPLSKLEEALSPETRELLAKGRKEPKEYDPNKRRPGRPRVYDYEPSDFFRTTIIAHKENYEKLKVIAMKLGRPFKDVLNDAMSAAIETFEEKHGEIILRKDHENPFKK